MTIPATRMTSLTGVNRILRAGLAALPIQTLEETLPAEAVFARDKLDDVLRDMLAEGWNMNTDREVTLTVDVTGKIAVPANALATYYRDDVRTTRNIVERGGFMYDETNQTDVFTEISLPFLVTRLLAFSDLPYALQRYVVARAARELHGEMVGNPARLRVLVATERLALQKLEEAEAEDGGYSVFDVSPASRIVYRRRPPFA